MPLPVAQRVADLAGRLTLEEKVLQMKDVAPAIPRLGIPEYNWWNEGLHGVARSGLATVFPQAIGWAATWNDSLIYRMATVISDEARAKHHEYARNNSRARYQGLTYWSPNINLFRDPRWGRGQETLGEDPYLTGRLAVPFIRGLQGDDPAYFKTVATVKHFAVHSGPEPERHEFDAVVSERDLRESYLPHFEVGIREGQAYSLMCAYNRLFGRPPAAAISSSRTSFAANGSSRGSSSPIAAPSMTCTCATRLLVDGGRGGGTRREDRYRPRLRSGVSPTCSERFSKASSQKRRSTHRCHGCSLRASGWECSTRQQR